MSKRWIYHATNEPKIINDGEFEAYEAEGWADSPARFVKLEQFGIDQSKIEGGDEEEAARAQQALDAVEGVKDSLNGALNVGTMNKDELESYAKEHFNVDIDMNKGVRKLRQDVKNLIQ